MMHTLLQLVHHQFLDQERWQHPQITIYILTCAFNLDGATYIATGFNVSGGVPIHLKVRNCRVDIFGKMNSPGMIVQYSKGRDKNELFPYALPAWDNNYTQNSAGNNGTDQTLMFVFEGPSASSLNGLSEFEEDLAGVGTIDCRVLISVDDNSISDLTVEVEGTCRCKYFTHRSCGIAT